LVWRKPCTTGGGCSPSSTWNRKQGNLSPEVKRPRRAPNRKALCSTGIKNGRAILHSPIRLHGAVLNELSRGQFHFSFILWSCVSLWHIIMYLSKLKLNSVGLDRPRETADCRRS
jgi:hypothetical protein